MTELRRQKTLVQQRLDAYIYPVLSLPNEIISLIFVHALPTHPNWPTFAGPGSPTLLTHICSKWRQIALSTPQLWAIIGPDHTSSASDNVAMMHRQCVLTETWISRSCSCPLSIQIVNANGEKPDCPPAVYSAIAAQRDRWEYFEYDVVRPNMRLFSGPMPLLRHLRVYLESGLLGPSIITVGHAPLLRSALLGGHALKHVELPWTQLTSLTLEAISPPECMPILQQTSNLVRCRLALILLNEGVDEPVNEVTLPELHSLVLNGQGKALTQRLIIWQLVTPALLCLECRELLLGPHPITTLLSFISRSSCKLEGLCITYENDSAFSLTDYRSAFPMISNISMQEAQDIGGEYPEEVD
ncbi:F-box domain-containing protein [Favolaschia claudopus]|uniref:F-box domain-containing protein n=1 Tax=Favolaschia claudopus TaxID=2862362 RepID=A0AAW0BZH9_9AGAR